MTHISSARAESVLANLIIFKVLIMNASEKGFRYELNPDEPLKNNLLPLQSRIL
jgi:hypothetical protein